MTELEEPRTRSSAADAAVGGDVATTTTSRNEIGRAAAGSTHNRPRRGRRHALRKKSRSPVLDRESRYRLLAGAALGLGCLFIAHWLRPSPLPLFAVPSGLNDWCAVVCGVAGIWLVPGQWLTALALSTGAGHAAWLGTRLGTTVAWYALVGPVIHLSGEGARVTPDGILLATVGATAAVCVGVALGLAPRPTQRWLRILIPAVVVAICTQITLQVWMQVWDFGMNYAHIKRLDWLIVMVCALLAAAGAVIRPDLPRVWAARNAAKILVFVTILIGTTAVVYVVGARWSPAQRMPSAVTLEQTPAPPEVDIALAATAVGPEGRQLVRQANFAVTDAWGHALPADTRIEVADVTDGRASLLITLGDSARPGLCHSGVETVRPFRVGPVKLTVRDTSSGTFVQAVIPDGWCDR